MLAGRLRDVMDSQGIELPKALQQQDPFREIRRSQQQQQLLVAEVFPQVGGGQLRKERENEVASFCCPLEEEVEEAEEEEEEDPSGANRRRARSLPADLLQDLKHANCCRKRVQFADMVGLDLASVKHFSDTEEPHVPSEVFSRLQRCPPGCPGAFNDLDELSDKFASRLSFQYWVPDFAQPRDAGNFLQRVRDNRVCLEQVSSSSHSEIRGLIRVLNFTYKKQVLVRYTFNDWRTYLDALAVYVVPPQEQADGATVADSDLDQFAFTLCLPPFMEKGSSVCFAICYKSDNEQYWDNNMGRNYTLRYQRTSAGGESLETLLAPGMLQ